MEKAFKSRKHLGETRGRNKCPKGRSFWTQSLRRRAHMCDQNMESGQSSLRDYATVTTCNILVITTTKDYFSLKFCLPPVTFPFQDQSWSRSFYLVFWNEKRGSESIYGSWSLCSHHFHSRFTSQSESDNQVATPDVNGAESTVLHRKWSDMEGLTIFWKNEISDKGRVFFLRNLSNVSGNE